MVILSDMGFIQLFSYLLHYHHRLYFGFLEQIDHISKKTLHEGPTSKKELKSLQRSSVIN